MNINILRKEFDELRNAPDLFDGHNFRARKEALDFVKVVSTLRTVTGEDYDALKRDALAFGERLSSFNAEVAQSFLLRFREEKPSGDVFRKCLEPYTGYVARDWGKPHYGYESLDFLLDGVLLPEPHPQADLKPEYGMVRYEPTPASVILELTERVSLTEQDVFFDLGSGLGKVTILVNLLTSAGVVGVEYQSSFCAYAEEQAASLGLERIRYLNADARDVGFGSATVFFFFNPFGGLIFDDVLGKLEREAKGRELILCSYGSASQPLSELTWLEELSPLRSGEMALAIFRSLKT